VIFALGYATLIALLSAAGLRISEALKLTVADVTRGGLLIRETKFRKTRLVPLHDTAVAGLKAIWCIACLFRTDPVFVDACSLPLRYCCQRDLRQAGRQAARTCPETPGIPGKRAHKGGRNNG